MHVNKWGVIYMKFWFVNVSKCTISSSVISNPTLCYMYIVVPYIKPTPALYHKCRGDTAWNKLLISTPPHANLAKQ